MEVQLERLNNRKETVIEGDSASRGAFTGKLNKYMYKLGQLQDTATVTIACSSLAGQNIVCTIVRGSEGGHTFSGIIINLCSGVATARTNEQCGRR
jgi:hypothetical protein